MLVTCAFCKNEYDRPKRLYTQSIKHGWRIFCNRECLRQSKYVGKKYNCATCNKETYRSPSELKSKSGKYFCSKHCSVKNRNKSLVGPRNKLWKNKSYRGLALFDLPNKCNRCNYEQYKEILIVHHIDRNRRNNNIKNLEILCPNCHAIEHYVKETGHSAVGSASVLGTESREFEPLCPDKKE